MIKKFLFPTLLIFLCAPWILPARDEPFDPLPTYYSYENIIPLRSSLLITLEELDKWEAPLNAFFMKHAIGYASQVHFYTYLYIAQREAAFLSYNTHRCFVGSLDPLIKQLVLMFFPHFTSFPPLHSDLYSEALAKEIFPYFQTRLEKERKNPRTYTPCDAIPISPRTQKLAKLISWEAHLPLPIPPTHNLKEEIEKMKEERKGLTEEQLHLIYAWAGEEGKETNWRLILNAYIQKHGISLGKALQSRALLSMGYYDAFIASFDAKYTYCIPRPFQVDSSFHPLIHPPHSPSYPSSHATQAGAAEVILSFFFPRAAQEWKKIAEDSANSRIWAGVHTPQDTQEGQRLGEKIGENILKENTM